MYSNLCKVSYVSYTCTCIKISLKLLRIILLNTVEMPRKTMARATRGNLLYLECNFWHKTMLLYVRGIHRKIVTRFKGQLFL
jgi:hypothetical protein